MSNPFGISDEALIAAVISGVMKQQTGQQAKGNSAESPLKFDTEAVTKRTANFAKQLYDAYIEAGFSQDQAFELVKGILTAKKN